MNGIDGRSGVMSDTPVTFRARVLLIWAISLSLTLVVGCFVGWLALDPTIRVRFTVFQISTLLFFVVVGIALMMGMGLSRVTADRDGLRIRNGIVNHQYAWSEITEIRYRPGDPWAYAILDDNPDDPTRRQILGVQSVDGERADQAVAVLRAMLTESRAR